ncbi:hypothetical protein BLNAU_8110 [Blattamonas nauphoetae]|uniref:Uncharacterized protein n=1 Tax=Blattamonas nauphoetae TaxID=2049346 RepID=A0ABQ9XZW0_9EUKA|nr:hypothetical protein BLNAU_8110 [Blattamonas nauphoetae]
MQFVNSLPDRSTDSGFPPFFLSIHTNTLPPPTLHTVDSISPKLTPLQQSRNVHSLSTTELPAARTRTTLPNLSPRHPVNDVFRTSIPPLTRPHNTPPPATVTSENELPSIHTRPPAISTIDAFPVNDRSVVATLFIITSPSVTTRTSPDFSPLSPLTLHSHNPTLPSFPTTKTVPKPTFMFSSSPRMDSVCPQTTI